MKEDDGTVGGSILLYATIIGILYLCSLDWSGCHICIPQCQKHHDPPGEQRRGGR